MSEYDLHIGRKTKLLNAFRRLFMSQPVERFLIGRISRGGGFWKKLVPPDYLYKKGSVRTVSINGIQFNLDISQVIDHLVYFRLEPEKFELVDEELGKADVIFDIGANIGATALYFAARNKKARIFSFEPHPTTFSRAKANLKLNNFEHLRIFNLGLGKREDKMKLYQVISNNPGMNRILPGQHPYPYIWVDVTTLDTFCRREHIEKIDFIKIDVEGFEQLVLEGGKEIIERSHPLIYLELYDHGLKVNGGSARELITWLQERGYDHILDAYSEKLIDAQTDLKDCDIDIIATRREVINR